MAEVALEVRDQLYRTFRAALASGDREAFRGSAAAAESPHAAYIADRRTRFERVLEAWAGRAPDTGAQALRLGLDLFNAGLFFDCHEFLEEHWRRAQGDERQVVHGLIQAGAALHKLELDPAAREGALYLLDRALEKLRGKVPEEGLAPVREIRRRVEAGTLRLSEVPEVRL